MKLFSILISSLLAVSVSAQDGRWQNDPMRDSVDSEGGELPTTESPVTSPPILTNSNAPSASPVTDVPITFEPTLAPITLAPIPVPTTPITLAPIPVPTAAPVSDTPSPKPTEITCTVDESGKYGITDGTPEFYDFKYEVELKEGSTANKEEVLALLEIAFAEKVLSLLFTECGSERVRLLRRKLAAVGVSTLPQDVEIPGAACTIAAECCVVDAEFTVVTDDGDVGFPSLLDTLATAAADGDFNEAHEDIVQVVFVDLDPSAGVGGPTPPPVGPQGSGAIGYGIYIASAAGALIVIGAAILYRRARNQNVDADSTIMTPHLNDSAMASQAAADTTAEPVYDLEPVN